MARRQELIPQILGAREAASGRGMSPRLRGSLVGKLMSVPALSLEAFYRAGGLGDMEALVRDAVGPRALGDTGADLVFTPVPPCRIVNTTVVGGPVPAGGTRDFYVNGSTAGTFETQGGTPGGCGIPDDATSVEMNFVAVGPAGPGDFRAFPWNAAPTVPNASIINYANVPGLNIANGLAQPVCNQAVTTCTFDLIVQADVSASDLVVDVVGFYHRVDTGAVKSFSVLGTGTESTAANACDNYGTLATTISTPVAGTVVVNAATTTRFQHVTGFRAELDFYWGTSPTACTTVGTFVSIPGALPSGTYYFPVAATQRLDVAAGSTTTFYFNSRAFLAGGAVAAVSAVDFAAMTATFVPD